MVTSTPGSAPAAPPPRRWRRADGHRLRTLTYFPVPLATFQLARQSPDARALSRVISSPSLSLRTQTPSRHSPIRIRDGAVGSLPMLLVPALTSHPEQLSFAAVGPGTSKHAAKAPRLTARDMRCMSAPRSPHEGLGTLSARDRRRLVPGRAREHPRRAPWVTGCRPDRRREPVPPLVSAASGGAPQPGFASLRRGSGTWTKCLVRLTFESVHVE